jgi:hypothetical protein
MKENRQTIMPRPLIAVMIVMLGIALLPIRWYGYYILLKLVVCGGCAFLAANAYDDGRKHLVWFMGGLAVLYNPIIRFPLGRELWMVINILTIIVLIAVMKSTKQRGAVQNKDSPAIPTVKPD